MSRSKNDNKAEKKYFYICFSIELNLIHETHNVENHRNVDIKLKDQFIFISHNEDFVEFEIFSNGLELYFVSLGFVEPGTD